MSTKKAKKNSSKQKRLPSSWSMLVGAATALMQTRKVAAQIILVSIVVLGIISWLELDLLLAVVAVISLANIWVVRNHSHKRNVSLAQAMYSGTFQFVPFFLSLLALLVALVPILFAIFLFQLATRGSVAIFLWEKITLGLVLIGVSVPSFYLIVVIILAMTTVSLPEVRPWQAFRASLELVRSRFWLVTRKLSVIMGVCAGIGALIMLAMIVPGIEVLNRFAFDVALSVVMPVFWFGIYSLYQEII